MKEFLSREEMEQRRIAAFKLFDAGYGQAAIAREYGVSRATASRWYAQFLANGHIGAKARKSTGRPAKLRADQITQIPLIYADSPENFGFKGRWSGRKISSAIHSLFGVKYNPDQANRILVRLELRTKRKRK